jgi:prepilin-type N-terminal cleavage/methylation domain-containing protein
MKSEMRKVNGGMTLIEVMLAVAILGFSFTVLLTAASRCIASIKQSQVYQKSQWTMAMAEAEYPLMKTNDIEELNVGPETFDNGLTYTREVEEDEDEDGLYVVRARVGWNSHGQERFDEVVSYIYKPIEDEDKISGGGASGSSGRDSSANLNRRASDSARNRARRNSRKDPRRNVHHPSSSGSRSGPGVSPGGSGIPRMP